MDDEPARQQNELLVMRGLLIRVAELLAGGALALLPGIAGAQSSPSDFTSAQRYDDAGHVTGTISADPDGVGTGNPFLAVRNTYDIGGRLIKVETGTLANWKSEDVAPLTWGSDFVVSQQVDTTYDGFDRKTSEAVSSGGTTYKVTQYSYDAYGRVECTAVRMTPATFGSPLPSACAVTTAPAPNGQDRITKNIYDAAGQVVAIQKAYDTSSRQDYVSYTYSLNGKPLTVIDANGNKARYTYDGFDRLVAWAFPSKTVGGSSAPCSIGTIGETTDAFGNLVAGPSESRNVGDDCEKYAYDRNGNRVKLMKRDADASDNTKANVIRYGYDNLNRMTVKDIPGGAATDVFYGYDLGGLQLFARFASASGLGITNVFDGFGKVSSTTNNMGATALTLGYLYDEEGNRIQLTYPDSSYFTYVYDKLNRLTTIKESGTTAIVSSTFDPQGRLSTQTRGAVTSTVAYDPISRPNNLANDLAGTASDLTNTFTFNPANQIMTKVRSNTAYSFGGYVDVNRDYTVNGLNQYTSAGAASFSYDTNGNLIGDGTNTYNYDVENRMTGAVISGSATTLKYDPLGRLWQIVLPSKTQTLTHDGDSIVFEATTNVTGLTSSARYIHGPDDDDPMIQYSTGSGVTTRYSLQPDYQGSIVSLADATGTKYAINAYDEYGITTTAFYGRFGFTGQAWVAQLGLYYYKARMYSPTLGRFMQTDPIGYEDQVNLYAYVNNDSSNRRDPSGKGGNPGDPFDSPGAAADDALKFINPTSISSNVEYAGYIYLKGDKYYSSIPTTSLNGTQVTHSVPRTAIGDWHTHGDYSRPDSSGRPVRTTKANDGYNSDHFSVGRGADTGNSETLLRGTGNGAFRSYLGTPSGVNREYDPVLKIEKPLIVTPPPPPKQTEFDK